MKKARAKHGTRGGGAQALPLPALAGPDPTPLAVHVYRCELVEERVLAVPRTSANSSRQAAEVIASFLARADREHFVVLLLDCGNRILGLNTAAIGVLDGVYVGTANVFKPALLRNAEKIILGHNHLHDPPGRPIPSRPDKELTAKLVEAGACLGIEVLDHVVVGKGEYFSFDEAGLMPSPRRRKGRTR